VPTRQSFFLPTGAGNPLGGQIYNNRIKGLLTSAENHHNDGNARTHLQMTSARGLVGRSVMSKPRKPRGLARFRKREITRAFEGVPGATSVEIFPADGRIVVHTDGRAVAPPDTTNPWDVVNAKERLA
jgi:hypothetical protein